MGAGAAGEGSAGEVAVEAGTLAVGVNRLMWLVCLPLAVVGFPESLGRLRGVPCSPMVRIYDSHS